MGLMDRKQDEDLYEVKEFLVSIMANAPYGIVAFDLQGEVIMINASALEYLGKAISVNNAIGKHIQYLIEDLPELAESVEVLLIKGGNPFDLGSIKINSKFASIKGRLIANGYILAIQDISDIKLTEFELAERTEELSAANTRLLKADRMKSLFLANMSHELRTPLNSIIGFTGMVLMGLAGELNAEQTKQLNIVKRNGKHLLSLINDILDISKVESGKMKIFPEKFLINDVIQEIIDTIKPLMTEKGLELLVDIPGNIEIRSDRKFVKQILINLIGNAIKFTSRGSVKIKASVLNEHSVEVRITDTGIGIKEADLDKLFGFFQQIDMSLTKNHEGTGLGLYLSKKLVTQLHGNITVHSKYNRGSEFTLSLPLNYGKGR